MTECARAGVCGLLEEKHPFEPAGALNSAKTKKLHCMKIKYLDFWRVKFLHGYAYPNFTDTSHNRVPRTGDTWASLRPFLPVNYPASPLLCDLDASDTQLLSEFYDSAQGIAESLEHWHALEKPLDNYNIWNVLMQRVQRSIRLGQTAVHRFCPDRLYDELVPVAGTLLVRSQRSLSIADTALNTFQNRCAAAGGSVPVSNPMGLCRNGRR
jgi:hypothetical protein